MSSGETGKRLDAWLTDVPVEDRQRLEDALHAGERIRWAVRPLPVPASALRAAGGTLFLLLLFLIASAALGGLAVLLVRVAAEQSAGVITFLAGGELFVFVLWLGFLYALVQPWREHRHARRCFYALTDERALVHEVKGVSSYALKGAPRDIRCAEDGRGGDIVWDYLPVGKHGIRPIGFIRLPDLDEALAQLRAAAGEDAPAAQPSGTAEAAALRPSLHDVAALLPDAPASLLTLLAGNLAEGERLLWAGKPRPHWVAHAGFAGFSNWLIPAILFVIGCCGNAETQRSTWGFALIVILFIIVDYCKRYRLSRRETYALGTQHAFLACATEGGQHALRRVPLAGARFRVVRRLGGGADIIVTPPEEPAGSRGGEGMGPSEAELCNLPDAAAVEALLRELGVKET